MLFEHHLNGDTSNLIQMSELRRDSSVDSQERYASMLDELVNTPFTLKKPVLFNWYDRNSSCWKFEQTRLKTELAETYIQDSKKCFDEGDFKSAKKHLERAIELQKDSLNLSLSWKYKDEAVQGMPELNPRYVLSRIFRTKAFYYHTLYSFKTNEAAILRAYQLSEISSRLWKVSADDTYMNKLKCLWYHTKATNTEDFGERISYSSKAVELNDPAIKNDHEKWEQQNNTVYFKKIEEVEEPAVLSINAALEIVK